MAGTKRTWRVMIPTWAVNWACYHPTTFEPHSGEGFARLVRVTMSLVRDGRPLQLLITPEEARGLAHRLIRQADAIDRMNQAHGNGTA